jgi:hypothetical protein
MIWRFPTKIYPHFAAGSWDQRMAGIQRILKVLIVEQLPSPVNTHCLCGECEDLMNHSRVTGVLAADSTSALAEV